MALKVLTFLGKDPRDTTYEWQGKTYHAQVMAQAIRQFADFDQMLVFVTPDARAKTFPILAALNDDRIQPVEIVDGKDAQSMWQVFQTVVNQVQENETVIFDITHGFRYLPFLTFLFIAYLKVAKKVTIQAVYYGAFEMQANDKTPILDLTEFVAMLDWLTAANQFIQTGSARDLAEQLKNAGQKQSQNADQAKALDDLAANVTEISLGLELLRPHEVAQASAQISERLNLAAGALPKPFGVVAQSLQAAYAQFGLPPQADSWQHLGIQLRMINWYFEKQQFVHALSMAREWLVSLLCAHFHLNMWDKDQREEMELLLNGGTRKENEQTIRQSPYLQEWQNLPHHKRLNTLWQGEPCKLANLRNDVLHSGFRKGSLSATTAIERTKQVLDEINQIARLFPQILGPQSPNPPSS